LIGRRDGKRVRSFCENLIMKDLTLFQRKNVKRFIMRENSRKDAQNTLCTLVDLCVSLCNFAAKKIKK
jgi:hypothetical protein